MTTRTERNYFTPGEEATLTRTISFDDIDAFARISGDENPIHLDEDYARETRFGGRIAHGLLVASLISAVFGTQLPGPGAIYLSQQLRFLAPVRPGDVITARVTVNAWDATKGRLTLHTQVLNQNDETVLDGEACLAMLAFLGTKSG